MSTPGSSMSTAPAAPTGGGGEGGEGGGADAPDSKPSLFKNCWSCRVISGGGLILSGAYVYSAARGAIRQGGPTSMRAVAQITFAASLAAMGLVVIVDPVKKRKGRPETTEVLTD